jgi:hypothetical protein
MAERELYNNCLAKQFPFEYICARWHEELAATLHQIEHTDNSEPHANFVTALNIILVWSGARTATLPSWEYCDSKKVNDLINLLSIWSKEVSSKFVSVDEVIIVHRPQIYRSGDGIQQELITRRNCPRVRLSTEPPVGDEEIGRELDMYHPNAEYFASGSELGDTAFSVWEVGSDALLYAEAWSEDFLSATELQEFLVHCEKRLWLWNSAMEKLGLKYRFYGTMDWKRKEIPWHEAEKTKRICGKEFLGVGSRGNEYSARVNYKVPMVGRQGSVGRSISAAA